MKIFGNKRKNVLVVGCNGMLGKELLSVLRENSSMRYGNIGIVNGIDCPDIDISDWTSVANVFGSSIRYDYVVNCAAITDTRRIENDLKSVSYKVNALGCRFLAKACSIYGSRLIHISTDYVFSEEAGNYNFTETSVPAPVNAYGTHKLLGEEFIKNELPYRMYSIIRVSWLYGSYNEKSFVHKFISNCFEKIKSGTYDVPCTDDEFSVPSNCGNVSNKILNVIRYGLYGVFHGNDKFDKPISRFMFANAILDYAKNVLKDSAEFCKLNCVPVHMECSEMRYPKWSVMDITDDTRFREGERFDWTSSLCRFITYEGRFKRWLIDSAKNTFSKSV